MAIMLVCGALLVAGLVVGIAGRHQRFRSPPVEGRPSVGEVARRYVWYVSLAVLAGSAAGVTTIGAGGRLAMRLLAVTGGDDAQGRITEADEVVGRITLGGTIGFMIFNGLFLGIAGAALYLLTRRLLPAGLIGGMVFGAGLLVLLGTTLEPLRDDNPDFDLVGPGWLAVLVFSGLALAYGIALAAFTARLSGWLPLLSTAPRVLVRYAWPAVVAIAGTVVTAAVAATGVAVVAATRWDRLLCLVRSPRAVLIGRVVLGAAVLAALPGALSSIVDIVTR